MSHKATPVSTAKGSKRNAQAVYQYTNTAHNRFRERLFLEKILPSKITTKCSTVRSIQKSDICNRRLEKEGGNKSLCLPQDTQ